MPRKIKANSPRAKLKSQMPVRIATVMGGTVKSRKQIAQDVQAALDNLNHVRTYPAGLKQTDVTAGPWIPFVVPGEDGDEMDFPNDSEHDDDIETIET